MNVLLLLAAAELQEARDKDASARRELHESQGGRGKGRLISRGDSTEAEGDFESGECSEEKPSVDGDGDSTMLPVESRLSSLKREASSPLAHDAARPLKRGAASPVKREVPSPLKREVPSPLKGEVPSPPSRDAPSYDGSGSEGSGDMLTEEDDNEEEDDEGDEGSGVAGGVGGHVGAGGKEMRRWTAEQDDALRAAVAVHRGQNWKAIAQMVEGRDHVQCLQRWKKVLQPGLVKGMWSKEEDELLLKLMSTSQLKNWAGVAALVPGRTAKQCRERWSLSLDPSINRGPWTQEEDELLIKLHDKLGNCWAQIKGHLVSRTENAVKTRFKTLERARVKDAAVAWTPALEAQLRELAVRFDCRIDEVTKHLPRSLRGISSHAMRQRCPLLRESEEKQLLL
jgi:hypothetical protein